MICADRSPMQVPKQITNVPSEILQPASQWKDQAEFHKSLHHLASAYSLSLSGLGSRAVLLTRIWATRRQSCTNACPLQVPH